MPSQCRWCWIHLETIYSRERREKRTAGVEWKTINILRHALGHDFPLQRLRCSVFSISRSIPFELANCLWKTYAGTHLHSPTAQCDAVEDIIAWSGAARTRVHDFHRLSIPFAECDGGLSRQCQQLHSRSLNGTNGRVVPSKIQGADLDKEANLFLLKNYFNPYTKIDHFQL